MILNVLLLLAMMGEGPDGSLPRPELRAFAPLVGTTWIATFPNGTLTDEQRFEWLFGGKFLRIEHDVRNEEGTVVYRGETIYAWDATQERIVFWYWNETGGFVTGTLEPEGDTWVAEGINHAPPPQTPAVRTVIRLAEDSWQSSHFFQRDGEWKEQFTITYRPKGGK